VLVLFFSFKSPSQTRLYLFTHELESLEPSGLDETELLLSRSKVGTRF